MKSIYNWGSQLLPLDEIGAVLARAGAQLYREQTAGMNRKQRNVYSNEQFRLLMEELQKPVGA